jgi:glycosyltransferase involved in cell wall biosynthesis
MMSIVIPTYRRPAPLTRCLAALAELDYPRQRFEVVVVDDGGGVPLDACIEPVRRRLDVRLIVQRNAGPATARNTGASQARGRFLAFTDDDCAPAPRWLAEMATHLAQAPDRLVGGHTLNVLRDNLYSAASQALIDYIYAYYNADPADAKFFASNNFALSTQRYWEIGGFDTHMPLAAGEDRDFCDRWLRRGNRMIYAPRAVIHHAHALRFRSYFRQHLNYGRGAYYIPQQRAQRAQQDIRVEPLAFYRDLLAHAAAEPPRRAAALTLLLAVSQIANAAGYFREKYRPVSPRPTHAALAPREREARSPAVAEDLRSGVGNR